MYLHPKGAWMQSMTRSSRFLWGILILFPPIVSLFQGYYGGYVYTFLIPFAWVVLLQKQPLSVLGFTRHRLKQAFVWGLFSGVALGGAGGALLGWVGHVKVAIPLTPSAGAAGRLVENLFMKSADGFFLARAVTPSGTACYFLYIVFAVGLGEELFWRGFIQNYVLGRRMPAFAAVALTSLGFAAAHIFLAVMLPGTAFFFMVLMTGLAGILWGVMFYRFRNIWGNALSHGLTAFILWRYFFFSV